VDRLGKERGDLRKRRLDRLSYVLGPVRLPSRSRSFRILFPKGLEVDVHRFEEVFVVIVGVELVGMDRRAFGQFQTELSEGGQIMVRSRRQKELDRLSGGRDQEMNAQSIEIPMLAGDTSAIRFPLIQIEIKAND
jgi:hypothetical protein